MYNCCKMVVLVVVVVVVVTSFFHLIACNVESRQQIVLVVVVQAVPVAYEDLPVTLPSVAQFQGHDGVSPLASAEHWLTAKCAK